MSAETAPEVPRLSWFQAYRWAPEKAPEGPLTILVSTADERVLVIRNTVARAQETFAACQTQAADLLLTVNGIPTLHHSRFAAEDRALLDHAVEQAIGKDSALGGRIVVGTQTLGFRHSSCIHRLNSGLVRCRARRFRMGLGGRFRRREFDVPIPFDIDP